jgi:hypothetical protein
MQMYVLKGQIESIGPKAVVKKKKTQMLIDQKEKLPNAKYNKRKKVEFIGPILAGILRPV